MKKAFDDSIDLVAWHASRACNTAMHGLPQCLPGQQTAALPQRRETSANRASMSEALNDSTCSTDIPWMCSINIEAEAWQMMQPRAIHQASSIRSSLVIFNSTSTESPQSALSSRCACVACSRRPR